MFLLYLNALYFLISSFFFLCILVVPCLLSEGSLIFNTKTTKRETSLIFSFPPKMHQLFAKRILWVSSPVDVTTAKG